MGFLKKIFKPVSKVLDKVLPNEIKPFLPYAAAFAPMIAPGIMGAFGNTMLSRAAIGGGLNIAGQLSQEGNEGDINLLSAGLGALTGAMTGPNAASDFRAMQSANKLQDANITRTALQKAGDFGLEGLAKGSEIFAAGMDKPFSMAGLKAAALPAATATGDLMFAQAKRDQDEYDRMMEEDAASDAASDAQRAFAIRRAMEAYGATEEEIEDAIYAAGYKTGGRVGFDKGGLGALGAAMKKEPETFSIDGSDILIAIPDNNPTIVGEGTQGGEKMLLIEVNGNTMMISEDEFYNKFGESRAKGGRVGFDIGGEVSEGKQLLLNKKYVELLKEYSEAGLSDADSRALKEANEFIRDLDFAKGGRVGLRFGGIGDAVENIEDAEMKEATKFAMQDMDIPIMDLVEEFEIQFKRKPNSMEELKQFYKDRYEYKGPGDVKMKEEIKEKVVMEAKDGGLMNLGGKEMDLRKGGFVPIGKKERADDVPARLSKNEFVMTADAVRAAGGGSVNEGAKRMYKVMNDLEARA